MARERTGASSFDELAVGLSSGTLSRGKALRLMGAALVGGVLASIPGIAGATPRLKPPGRRCKRGDQCCTHVLCVDRRCAGILGRCSSCPADCICVIDDEGLKCPVRMVDFVATKKLQVVARTADPLAPLPGLPHRGPGDFKCASLCST